MIMVFVKIKYTTLKKMKNIITTNNKKEKLELTSNKFKNDTTKLVINTRQSQLDTNNKVRLNKNLVNNKNTKVKDNKDSIEKYKEFLKLSKKILVYRDFFAKISKIQQPNSLSQTYLYEFNRSNKYRSTLIGTHIKQLLNEFFGSFYYLIGKPVLLHTQRRLSIFVNYYIPGVSPILKNRHLWRHNILPTFSPKSINQKIDRLCLALSKLLNKKVTIQLNRLKYPYQDSQILSKFVSLGANSMRFGRLVKILFRKASIITKKIQEEKDSNHFYNVVIGKRKVRFHKSIPSVLTGLKIKISGRLMNERVKPKRTIKKREIGGFCRNKNSIIDYSIYTNKNKRGAYSVKIWTTNRILRKRY